MNQCFVQTENKNVCDLITNRCNHLILQATFVKSMIVLLCKQILTEEVKNN